MNALQALETTACCLSRIEGMLTQQNEYEVLAAVRLARKEVENMAAEEKATPGTYPQLDGICE